MKFGLKVEDIKQISDIISSVPEVHQAIIFGSRAMGNYKIGSDVDIAIKGEKITHEIVTEIKYRLNEETTMPYFFDVVDYDKLQNEELITHIDQFGKVLSTRPSLQKHAS
jgi:predicted nucleotidyltransferase